MPADPSPAVILLVPALDAGVAAAPAPSGSMPPDPSSVPPAVADPLADAVDGGTFERRPLEARPWEARLMTLLGLLDPEASASAAPTAIPAARLLGPDDLDGSSAFAAGDVAAAASAGRLVVADPVSLTPGRDEATLAPPETLALAREEADALIEAANALLADDGIALARGASGRWYLAGLDARGLDTPPTHFLARREAGAHLPGSSEAAPWRRLMTELQMLWHTHPVNAAREARGEAVVNGVWFWGGAPVPDGSAAANLPPSVVTTNGLAAALARHAGAAVVEAGGFDEALARASGVVGTAGGRGSAGGGTLLVVDTDAYAAWLANDPVALEGARGRILRDWLAPAARAALDGRAASLVVAGGDGGEAVFVPPARRSWFAGLFAGIGRR